jgi:hypothetical protein
MTSTITVPVNPMITVVNLDTGEVEHMRKLVFEDHYEGFGFWFRVEIRHCETCQCVLPFLAGGIDGRPWRVDTFPRCSRHAF